MHSHLMWLSPLQAPGLASHASNNSRGLLTTHRGTTSREEAKVFAMLEATRCAKSMNVEDLLFLGDAKDAIKDLLFEDDPQMASPNGMFREVL